MGQVGLEVVQGAYSTADATANTCAIAGADATADTVAQCVVVVKVAVEVAVRAVVDLRATVSSQDGHALIKIPVRHSPTSTNISPNSEICVPVSSVMLDYSSCWHPVLVQLGQTKLYRQAH